MRREKIGIVTTKLPKMGEKKKRIVSIKLPKSWGGIIVILAIDWRKKNIYVAIDLWQWNCQNLGEEFNSNFGNEVAKNEEGGGIFMQLSLEKRRFRLKIGGKKTKNCGN